MCSSDQHCIEGSGSTGSIQGRDAMASTSTVTVLSGWIIQPGYVICHDKSTQGRVPNYADPVNDVSAAQHDMPSWHHRPDGMSGTTIKLSPCQVILC